jgi:hypothetical protein
LCVCAKQYIAPSRAVELRKIEATRMISVAMRRDESRGVTMLGNFEDIQKMSKNNIDMMTQSFGTLPKTAQAVATEMVDYSKRSFENSTKAVERLFGVKSLDKAIEVQSEYAKTIYEDYTAQVTKLGELYVNLAKEIFKPFEGYVVKTPSAL